MKRGSVRRCGRIGAVATLVIGLVAASVDARGAATSTDWPGYQHGPAHRSVATGDAAITATNAAGMHSAWRFVADPATQPGQPAASFDASPTVVGGVVYIGAKTGIFTALRASDGTVIWRRQLDFGSGAVCGPNGKGIVGTASVLPDPTTGALTVYAPGAHSLYALDATTGAIRWRTAIGPDTADGAARWYNWSSPTVVGGRVYMGLGANCGAAKIRGGEVQLDQHTGTLLHTWYDVPVGTVGATVWSSAAGDGTSVWVSTGNPDPSAAQVYDAFSVVRLDAATFTEQDKWTASIPKDADLDFGSSPTLYTAAINGTTTTLVGACNKNGIYYAWRADALSAGPVWQDQVGQIGGTDTGACITSAAWDVAAKALYVAANQSTVNGVAVPGSVRSLVPGTGRVKWLQPLACLPNGSPTLNATTNVLAVPLYGCPSGVQPGVQLFNATTGAPLAKLTTTKPVFAQPVFAEGALFVAGEGGVLTKYLP